MLCIIIDLTICKYMLISGFANKNFASWLYILLYTCKANQSRFENGKNNKREFDLVDWFELNW